MLAGLMDRTVNQEVIGSFATNGLNFLIRPIGGIELFSLECTEEMN